MAWTVRPRSRADIQDGENAITGEGEYFPLKLPWCQDANLHLSAGARFQHNYDKMAVISSQRNRVPFSLF